MRALVLDHRALAVAGGAGHLCLHHAEHRAHGLHRHAATLTRGARLGPTAALGSRAVAVVASDILAHLKLLGDTCGHLLQGEFHRQPQVGTAILRALRASAAAAETAEAPETGMAAKDVAEHGEDVVHVHATTSAEASETALRAVEAELVVTAPLLRVVEHVVGFGSLLELLLRLGVSRVAVGVIFDGYLAIGLFDFFIRSASAYFKHLIVVSFLCHLLVCFLVYTFSLAQTESVQGKRLFHFFNCSIFHLSSLSHGHLGVA